MTLTLHDDRPKNSRTRPGFVLIAVVSLLASTSIVEATVYGVDERNQPSAQLTTEDDRLYSATQAIVCQRPQEQLHAGAGTLADDFVHGVTVAHLFFDEKTQRNRTAAECKFRVYDHDGRLLDEVAITRLRSLWTREPRWQSDDLAMFELARRPKFVDRTIVLAPAEIHVGEQITLVAYHYDIRPAFTKRKTRGRIYSTLGSREEGVPNIFHTDVDCVPMSSGGPLYDSSGVLIGILRGSSSSGYGPPRIFAATTEFNQAIRFGAQFVRGYAEFRKGR
jgi:hypothetical protein